MEIGNSQIIENALNHEKGIATLTGFTFVPPGRKDRKFRLYPGTSTDRYLEIDEQSVESLVPGTGAERSAVSLKKDARVVLIDRTEVSAGDLTENGDGWTSMRGKLPPWADRLKWYLAIASAQMLEMYLGTESIPGTGQTGRPGDDL